MAYGTYMIGDCIMIGCVVRVYMAGCVATGVTRVSITWKVHIRYRCSYGDSPVSAKRSSGVQLDSRPCAK